MTIQQIEKFIALHVKGASVPVKISFKTRNRIDGIFILAPDFEELKKKNFWRVVTSSRLDDYQRSKDLSHARVFNGMEFVKLSQG